MELPMYFIYLIYTSILALTMVILIPRKDIHKLTLLGIFYGGIIDILWIVFIGLIGAGGYLNYGPLGFKSIPFIPPIAWTIFFVMFIYFLPNKKPWNYLFALVATGYSLIFSNVLSNLGIFEWTFSKVIVPFGIYLTWFLFVTWNYGKYGEKFVQTVILTKVDSKKRY